MELALIGAPNTGKTTVFNALCKRHEKTGNFAGITVAPAYGKLCTDPSVTLVDLPGIYALATLSLEERVTRNYLQTQKPDGIVTVLDATHPEKSLALLLQLTPLGFPILAVFTMTDLLSQKGVQFSDAAFARVSGVPCLRADSLSPQTFLAAVRHARAAPQNYILPNIDTQPCLRTCFAGLSTPMLSPALTALDRFLADESLPQKFAHRFANFEKETLRKALTAARFAAVEHLQTAAWQNTEATKTGFSRADRLLLHKFFGLPLFFLLLSAVYFGCIVLPPKLLSLIPAAFSPLLRLQDAIAASALSPFWKAFFLQGIGAPIQMIESFLVQLTLLFFCLAFLEECGYLARVAFLLDRPFSKIGLSGKALVCYLLGCGCSVCGILACRSAEDGNRRKLLCATVPLLPCSAKLPVLALFYEVYGPPALCAIPLCLIAAFGSAAFLSRFPRFQTDGLPFFLELPDYHFPRLRVLLRSVGGRLADFCKKALTVLLPASVLLFLLTHIGIQNARLCYTEPGNASLLFFAASSLRAWFAPLGFGNPQTICATLFGTFAKEGIVTVLLAFAAAGGQSVSQALCAWLPTLSCGMSFLLFQLFCPPCFAAISAMAKECADRATFRFLLFYQNLLACSVSCFCYAICGRHFSLSTLSMGFLLAGLWLLLCQNERQRPHLCTATCKLCNPFPQKDGTVDHP